MDWLPSVTSWSGMCKRRLLYEVHVRRIRERVGKAFAASEE